MRYLFILIVALFLSGTINAQVNVNVNINLDKQPGWGPTGYDYVQNYYLPDIEVYFNVPQHRFYYYQGGRWIGRSSLPPSYTSFNLYNSHKVVINEKQPWRNHAAYKDKFASFEGKHDQQTIRDSKDPKYFVNKNHPQHKAWVKQQKHDNGKH